MSERFQGRKRPMEGVEEEDRPRKLWKGPLWVDPTLDSRVPFAGKTVVVPKPLPDSYPNPKEGEGVTQAEVNPTESQQEVQVREAEEEEFWVSGTGRAFPVSQDFDWQSKDREDDGNEELLDYEDWEFSDSELEQPEIIDLGEPPVTDREDLSDIRNIYWIGKPLERRHHPGRTD